ncbi:MAG: hypothetical protein ACK4RK_08990 [Gemmataceae bacterium]
MTALEWQSCDDPNPLLDYLEGRVSERKLRLFACACCARIAALITAPCCRQALEQAERHADGGITAAQLAAVHTAAQNGKPLFAVGNWAAAWSAAPVAAQAAFQAARFAAQAMSAMATESFRSLARAAVCAGAPEAERAAAWDRYDTEAMLVLAQERRQQADLLREIMGNPFTTAAVPTYWPGDVVDLAEALYHGEDCHFALHDALEEADLTTWALHFREPGHPKGCWLVDCILAKT